MALWCKSGKFKYLCPEKDYTSEFPVKISHNPNSYMYIQLKDINLENKKFINCLGIDWIVKSYALAYR